MENLKWNRRKCEEKRGEESRRVEKRDINRRILKCDKRRKIFVISLYLSGYLKKNKKHVEIQKLIIHLPPSHPAKKEIG